MNEPSAADRWARVQSLLADALEVAPGARDAFLDAHCGSDPNLRAEVASLLAAADEADRYFGQLADRAGITLLAADPAPEGASAAAGTPARTPGRDFVGRRLGQYRILSWLGSGGSASVYLAEREGEGFTQRVALKLVPRRIADPLIVRRSNEERRILARLEHRNIARLIDGGLTPEGFSYYAMEYVDGGDLLTFCDERRLRVKERLELFLEVCAAVQFAHARLVIHCDLKPGNIFVTHEGHVKLLDFGVARMIDPDSAGDEATGLWFTPGYASPEQVRRQPPGTHSDVYSLGVVLYEMLTGHRPYRFKEHDLDEVTRVVCGRLPDVPSRVVLEPSIRTREGDEYQTFPDTVAAARRSTPERLRKRLTGDLDAIVMKALAKHPDARYSTVEQLSADIQRHLAHGLIASVSPTPRYRLLKFSRRHRRALVSGALVLGTLLVGAAGTLWQAGRASDATGVALREAEKAELVAALMLDILRLSDPSQALGDTISAREILDRGAERIVTELGTQPVVQASLLSDVAVVYANLGLYSRSEPLMRRALRIRMNEFGPESLEASESLAQLGDLRAQQGDVRGAIEILERAIAIRASKVEGPDSTLVRARTALGWQVRAAGEYDRAAGLFSAALEAERQRDPQSPHLAQAMLGLASALHDAGRFDKADSLFRDILADMDPGAGPSPAAVSALTNVGMLQRLREQYREAERLLRTAVDMALALYGPDHVMTLTTQAEWGLALYATGAWGEAEAMYRDAVARASRTLGPMDATTGGLQEGLATVLAGKGEFEEALALLRKGMEERRFRYGDVGNPAFVAALTRIAELLIALERLDEAKETVRQAVEMNARFDAQSELGDVYTILTEQALANIAWREGRAAAAEGHFRAALTLADRLLRPDHRYTQTLKRDYGVFLGSAGRTLEAVEMLEWVLQTQRRLLGGSHPQVARTAAALRDVNGGGA